ncbi:diamine acetyltransferase 2-like [Actinia tenebrosa]|uniref:Diamine acetyltransferase 2-like n=1 Tax=Actinia tenebrosa TaxID=6105 RepID=A0A6P8IU62_ACTTE|nr:diamine acetyltransferase 2-like [Actinia tenebrosa]
MESRRNFEVRPAVERDVPAIAKMIKGLAQYLGESDKLKTGEEELLRDGFGANQLFHCLVAEEIPIPHEDATVSIIDPARSSHRKTSTPRVKEILGIAIYFYTYSTWEGPMLYLEDLFVIPFARGQGIGTSIMKSLAKIAADKKCSRMQWMSPQGRPSVRFYEKFGAECLGDWCVFRLGKAEINELKSDAAEPEEE